MVDRFGTIVTLEFGGNKAESIAVNTPRPVAVTADMNDRNLRDRPLEPAFVVFVLLPLVAIVGIAWQAGAGAAMQDLPDGAAKTIGYWLLAPLFAGGF